MNDNQTIRNFLNSLLWIKGKPFCPCCHAKIEACHKCKKRTAFNDVTSLENKCDECKQKGKAACKVCDNCFKNN